MLDTLITFCDEDMVVANGGKIFTTSDLFPKPKPDFNEKDEWRRNHKLDREWKDRTSNQNRVHIFLDTLVELGYLVYAGKVGRRGTAYQLLPDTYAFLKSRQTKRKKLDLRRERVQKEARRREILAEQKQLEVELNNL